MSWGEVQCGIREEIFTIGERGSAKLGRYAVACRCE